MSLSALGDDPRKIKRNGVIRRSRCIKVLSARNTHNARNIFGQLIPRRDTACNILFKYYISRYMFIGHLV